MGNNLETKIISFKNMNIEEDESLFIKPEERFENLTTHQINTLKINHQDAIYANSDFFGKYKLQNAKKESKLQKYNMYYSYIPKFYLKELSFAKLVAFTYIGLFSLFVIGTIVLASLILTQWKNNVNPYILLFLIPIFILIFPKFIFSINRYKNFYTEAKTINFRDEKVLSSNIQKIYRKLKTSYIDVNWLCSGIYVISLLTVLINSLLPIFIYKTSFADFNTPIDKDNQYTYMVLFWTTISLAIVTFGTHMWILISNYLRAANIENFYNYMLIDPNEITNIKKAKNKRDAIIFLATVITIAFLIWIIVKILKRRQATKVVVK